MTIAAAMLLVCSAASAQNVLGRLAERAKNQINSAFMMVSLVVINITQYAYAVPLVSNTVEDGYGQ